jgi:hypothetical protein
VIAQLVEVRSLVLHLQILMMTSPPCPNMFLSYNAKERTSKIAQLVKVRSLALYLQSNVMTSFYFFNPTPSPKTRWRPATDTRNMAPGSAGSYRAKSSQIGLTGRAALQTRKCRWP